jgi:hypothetical protein
MKALHGFSPVTAAALLVAAIVLPVVLFPLGAAVVANVLFVYGYKQFDKHKSVEAFQACLTASMIGVITFVTVFLAAPFEWLYASIRSSTLLGFAVRNQLPAGLDLSIFKINVFFALVGPGAYMFYVCFKHANQLKQIDDPGRVSRRPIVFLYAALPVIIPAMILVKLNYFGDLGLGYQKYQDRDLVDAQTRDLLVVGLTFSASSYSLLRTLLRNFLSLERA